MSRKQFVNGCFRLPKEVEQAISAWLESIPQALFVKKPSSFSKWNDNGGCAVSTEKKVLKEKNFC